MRRASLAAAIVKNTKHLWPDKAKKNRQLAKETQVKEDNIKMNLQWVVTF
jgi:hypothetical protein